MKTKSLTNIKTLFFDNKTIKQTIFKNTFWLTAATVTTRFLKFLLFIYIARILGATEYGKFTFALAFIGLLAIFSDFGLSSITSREFAREREKEKEFPAILSLKIFLSLGTLILILAGSFFITPDLIIRKIIWILAIYIVVINFTQIISAFFWARQKMEYESFARIFDILVLTGIGFFILFHFPSAPNLSYGYLFAALATLIFVLIFFHLKIQRLSLKWDKAVWKEYLSMSWPLAFAAISISIFTQIDSIMMGHLKQITQTGWYNACTRVMETVLVPRDLIAASFGPALCKFSRQSKEEFQKLWNNQMEIMMLLAIPLMAGGLALAPKIIEFIYGSAYIPSILAFQILLIGVVINFPYVCFQQTLIIFDQQKKFFLVVLLGAITNIILNLILIPKFSLYGAALSTILTLLLIFSLTFKFAVKFVTPINLKLFLCFVGALVSSLIMYFVISRLQIFHLHVLLFIIIGAAVYFATFFGLRFGLKYFKIYF